MLPQHSENFYIYLQVKKGAAIVVGDKVDLLVIDSYHRYFAVGIMISQIEALQLIDVIILLSGQLCRGIYEGSVSIPGIEILTVVLVLGTMPI